jgi:YegS/Rv2252/BmrU family lipid kinase
MKHYFILNPAAGSGKFVGELSQRIIETCRQKMVEFDVYVTKKEGDATDFVRKVCLDTPDGESARFYSCGGDGTNYEVISGAYGFDNVAVGFIPSGTGNDFIRCFDGKENFHDVAAQLEGSTDKIDLIKCNDRYIMNMLNTGFDCEAARKAAILKTKPHISSSMAYIMGVVSELIRKPTTGFTVSIDGGEPMEKSPLLLSTFSNGRFCGGGFKSSPKARLQSGFIDVCFIKEISRTKFVSIVSQYRSGAYLFNEKLNNIVEYCRAKTVDLDFGRIRSVCIDGEIFDVDKLRLEIIPRALSIIIPHGASFAENESEGAKKPILA